jgi:hypothetical protein
MTPRELVHATLAFTPGLRAPRQVWALPGAWARYGEELKRLEREFPSDFTGVWCPERLRSHPRTQGDMHRKGTYIDEWGCTFLNLQDGIIGEVKEPLVKDWEQDAGKVHFPEEWLTLDRQVINAACAASDRFVFAACNPRPFEQLQFIRGTPELMMDLADPSPAFLAFMARMHDLYCRQVAAWAATDVDAISFMDDWGSQRSLLISPAAWRRFFKPMYADYVRIAHAAGKRAFMHSDGHILAIYPDLIEIGVDALNSQIFCMGVEQLAPFAGRITFWGEIDRQRLLPRGTPAEIDAAVRLVHATLGRRGGCIAQCEWGADAPPENAFQVFRSWDAITGARAAGATA